MIKNFNKERKALNEELPNDYNQRQMIHKINKWSRKTQEKGLKINHKSLHTFKSVTIMFHPKYPDNTMRSHTPNIATIMPPTQPFPTKQNINHLRRHHPMHPKSIKMKKKMMMRKMIRYLIRKGKLQMRSFLTITTKDKWSIKSTNEVGKHKKKA